MFIDITNPIGFRASAASVAARSASVELNPLFPRSPWMLRCYGAGRCTIGRGVPKYYGTEAHADAVAATWVATGASPADQDAA